MCERYFVLHSCPHFWSCWVTAMSGLYEVISNMRCVSPDYGLHLVLHKKYEWARFFNWEPDSFHIDEFTKNNMMISPLISSSEMDATNLVQCLLYIFEGDVFSNMKKRLIYYWQDFVCILHYSTNFSHCQRKKWSFGVQVEQLLMHVVLLQS